MSQVSYLDVGEHIWTHSNKEPFSKRQVLGNQLPYLGAINVLDQTAICDEAASVHCGSLSIYLLEASSSFFPQL